MAGQEQQNWEKRGLGYLLRRSYLPLHRSFGATISPLGMTPDQYLVLALLQERDGLSGQELADELPSDANTVVGILSRLTDKGWIRRDRDPEDRRVRRNFLESSGREALGEARRLSSEVRRNLLRALTPQEQATLRTLLLRVAATLSD